MNISIVTPSYNQGLFLPETIESVLNQNLDQIEYIVLDGGSYDNSVEIIQKYEAHLTYWCSHPDKGQAAAIHEGFLCSSGDILAWLNSDDMFTSNSLSYVLRTFTQNPKIRFLYGGCEMIDGMGHHIKYLREPCFSLGWQIFVRNCIPQSSAFWRRDLYFEVGGLDISLRHAMDYDLFFRFCAKTRPYVTRRILSRQRWYAETKTLSDPLTRDNELEIVRRRYYDELPATGSRFKHLAWRAHRILIKGLNGCYFPFSSLGPRN